MILEQNAAGKGWNGPL